MATCCQVLARSAFGPAVAREPAVRVSSPAVWRRTPPRLSISRYQPWEKGEYCVDSVPASLVAGAREMSPPSRSRLGCTQRDAVKSPAPTFMESARGMVSESGSLSKAMDLPSGEFSYLALPASVPGFGM